MNAGFRISCDPWLRRLDLDAAGGGAEGDDIARALADAVAETVDGLRAVAAGVAGDDAVVDDLLGTSPRGAGACGGVTHDCTSFGALHGVDDRYRPGHIWLTGGQLRGHFHSTMPQYLVKSMFLWRYGNTEHEKSPT